MKSYSLSGRVLRLTVSCLVSTVGILSWALRAADYSSSGEQSLREKLHGVLLRHRLSPALRSGTVRLAYSPDGKYLLAQDSSGVYLLTRNPLQVQSYVLATNSYAARFSPDSKMLTIVSWDLNLSRWSVPDGRNLENRPLSIPDGCLGAQLSPDGEKLACYRPDFRLSILQLSTGDLSYSEPVRPPPGSSFFVPVSLDRDTAFAGAFGYVLARDMRPLANLGVTAAQLLFSPDGNTLLAGDNREAVVVDLVSGKHKAPPGGLKKRMNGTMDIAGSDRVLTLERGFEKERDAKPAIVSLTTGDVLATPSFTADSFRLATNTRYALLLDGKERGVRIFDLEEDKAVETAPNISADVFAQEFAILSEVGELSIFPSSQAQPVATTNLRPALLPILRCASVSQDMRKLAIAVDGEGALFQIEDGKRIEKYPRFASVNFAEDGGAFALFPRRWSLQQQILHLEPATGASSPAWTSPKEHLRAGGAAWLEYSFESPQGRGVLVIQKGGVPYHLRALDAQTGKELWKRSFLEEAPVPFADPQGDRLVLGWKGNSAGAKEAAKRDRVSSEIFRKSKIAETDSFFEAIDVSSGKGLGGVLVQVGGGAESFDGAFSVGDALFLLKDSLRLSLYSLRDGSLKARLRASRIAANAQSDIFAADDGTGRLNFYDLQTGALLDEQLLPEGAAYLHFSPDGNKLLILTEHQILYLLDTSTIRQSTQPPPNIH